MDNEPQIDGVKISEFPTEDSFAGTDLVTGLKSGANANFRFSAILQWLRSGIASLFIPVSAKGAAGGVAELDSNGKVPVAQLSMSASSPSMDGTASPGTSSTLSRGDHVHPSDTTKVSTSTVGAANGVAGLDGDGKVPSSQLPTIPDEAADIAYNPATSGLTATNVQGAIDEVVTDLSGKQDEITASGILKGDGAGGVSAATPGTDYGTYSKPSGGIPSSDMASAVQTSLGKADSAYQKPSGGIPASDLASGVIPTVPSAYTSNPAMDGTASPGSSGDWARGDHVHPTDTGRRTAASVQTQLFATRTSVSSDTTLTLTGAYTGYESLAILFESVSGNYDRRMTVVVPVFSIRFSSWFALADSTVSGAVRIVNVTEGGTVNEQKIRIQATTLSSLYVNRIDAIK